MAAGVAFVSQDERRVPVGRPPLDPCPCTRLMSCNRSISPARNPQIHIVLHLHTTCMSAGTSHNVTLHWSAVYSTFLFEVNIRLVRELAASFLLPTFAFFNLLLSLTFLLTTGRTFATLSVRLCCAHDYFYRCESGLCLLIELQRGRGASITELSSTVWTFSSRLGYANS